MTNGTMRTRAARAVVGAVLLGMLAACGGTNAPRDGGAQRGGGSRQPSQGQRTGAQARNNTGSAASQGSEMQGLTCDSSLEGAAACTSDTQVVFCAGGDWYLLSCDAVLQGGYCGFDTSSGQVDCYTDGG